MPRPGRRGNNLGRRTHHAARYHVLRDVPHQPQTSSNNDTILAQSFVQDVTNLKYRMCSNCLTTDLKDPDNTSCTRCTSKSNRSGAKYTEDNDMYPGEVPEVLQGFTETEKMLIARVNPVMKIYRLKAAGGNGQLRYSGNIINIFQDVTSIARTLPHLPETVNNVCVRRTNATGYRDFRVRRQKVLDALRWLQKNHKYYRDIEISQAAVNCLPIDGDILHQDSNQDIDETGDESESVTEHFISEYQATRHQDRVKQCLNWPAQSTSPLSEFTTAGYVSMAFPCLFPYGKGDITDKSRPEEVSLHVWAVHLMRFKDQRFARDCRFRYFLLNTIQRAEAIKRSSVYAKQCDFRGSLAQLRETVARYPNIVNRLLAYGSTIRGSSSYWYQRRRELECMVKQLGVPTLFLTVSAADIWWPCLIKHYGLSESQFDGMSEGQMARVMQKMLSENPLIADEYFTTRVEKFMKVLKTKLEIVDFWYRFEYQHRGSPHAHMVVWLKDAPDVRLFESATAEEINEYRCFYDRLCTAKNPGLGLPRAERHPCRDNITAETFEDNIKLGELLNRVQRHTEHSKYCQIKANSTCRFGFPKPINLQSTLEKNEHGHWVFTPQRDDSLMNSYNPFIAKTWRSNTDCQVIASEHAIVAYIAKYATKSEPRSETLKDFFVSRVTDAPDDTRPRSIVSQVLIKMIGQRDISACEVTHTLLSLPMYHSSRRMVKVYLGNSTYGPVTDAPRETVSVLEGYENRPNTQFYQNMGFTTFAKNVQPHKKDDVYSFTHYQKERVIQVIPDVKLGRSESIDEVFYMQQLVLNSKFNNHLSLKTHETWKESFNARALEIWELPDPEPLNESDINEDEPEIVQRDFMLLAEAMPQHIPRLNEIGYRDIDIEHNWCRSYDDYPGIESKLKFIEEQKALDSGRRESPTSTVPLNDEQNEVLKHAIAVADGRNEYNHVIVMGSAGTGKSCVIKAIVHRLHEKYGEGSVLLLAPTGVAANNINGQTIHSALKISPSRSRLPILRGENLRDFDMKMSRVRLIIIDEFSMIGLTLLGNISRRLSEASGTNTSLGGFPVFFFGDFNQLPPVRDLALYADPKTEIQEDGHIAYRSFQKCFILKTIMRQQGSAQSTFRNVLHRLATGETNSEDMKVLRTRFGTNMQNIGTSVLRLMATNEQIVIHNEQCLRNLNEPVAIVNAISNNRTSSEASEEEAQGLQLVLRLAVGARVMLQTNLWTEMGLCNGTLGTVMAIVYNQNTQDIFNEQPLCVLVRFDGYIGPAIYNGLVPITPRKVSFRRRGVNCTRTQIPLKVAYAVTIHKSQGMSVEQAVVDIGTTEFSSGLAYVGFSRVKTLDGLTIYPPFPESRLVGLNKRLVYEQRQAELKRLEGLQ